MTRSGSRPVDGENRPVVHGLPRAAEAGMSAHTQDTPPMTSPHFSPGVGRIGSQNLSRYS